MKVMQHKLNTFIFTNKQVCILLAGAVEVVSHQKGVETCEIIGRLEAGDIIGFA